MSMTSEKSMRLMHGAHPRCLKDFRDFKDLADLVRLKDFTDLYLTSQTCILCDRVLTELDPIHGPSTFGYDLAGRRTSLSAPAGKYTYFYDAADELTSQQTPTGSISY